MLSKLQDIEEEILAHLEDSADFIYTNPLDPIMTEGAQGKYLCFYFTQDNVQAHDQYGSAYALQATIEIECLLADKDKTTLFNKARNFASTIQEKIKEIENGRLYQSLHYTGAVLVRADANSTRMIGFKLSYTFDYNA